MKRLITIALCTFLSQMCTAQVMMLLSSDSLTNITSPLDVDSLFYWFAADVAVLDSAGGTISNGEGVGTWTDLSGNGYNVVQADTTKDPRWCASCGPASYPAIVFNGVDEFLASAAHWWGSDDLTVFVVMKYSNATRNAAELIISKRSATVAQWNIYGANALNAYRELFQPFKDGGLTNYNDIRTGDNYKHTTWKLKTRLSNGDGTAQFYDDGSTITTIVSTIGTGDGTIHNASLELVVGALYATSSILHLQGSISEIIVFSRALSATERTAIELYLNRKYDLYYLIILAFPLASARRRKLFHYEKKNAA